MLKLTFVIISSISIWLDLGSRSAQAQGVNFQAEKVCQVTDPTGTPLNARLHPNGRIVDRLKNGQNVYIQAIDRDDRGKPWILVATKDRGNYKVIGYVLREFVSCY